MVHGQSKRACVLRDSGVAIAGVVTGTCAGCGVDFTTWVQILFLVTMVLCEIIKEKSGRARKKAILRLLAEVDKVVNMVLYLSFTMGRLTDDER
jgi:hypothetical protein